MPAIQVFWNFGLANAVKRLEQDPTYRAAAGQNRHRDQPNTLWGSEVAADIGVKAAKMALDAGLTGEALDPLFQQVNSMFVIGEDGFQPFQGKAHSTNIVVLK